MIGFRVDRFAVTCLAALLAIGTAMPAAAIQIVAKGDIMILAGAIKPGDSLAVRDFYRKSPSGTYRFVYLASGGGFIVEAIEIGRLIRSEGLMTVVDAKVSTCASACTAIFAAGKQRIYLNAKGDKDGQLTNATGGLGFHDGSNASSRDANHYSGKASALMISAYYEFGVPGAAELIGKAPPDRLYRVSGPRALQLGIATSLGK